MSNARFLQIHTLTSYAATLLNRDDAGFAKRLPFGGGVRTRVSSQCLKRHWRVYDGPNSLKGIGVPESVRSRVSFEKHVVEPLVAQGLDEATVRAATAKLVGQIFGSEAKKEKQAKNKKGGDAPAPPVAVETAQVTVLGIPELEYLRSIVADACKSAASPDAAAEAIGKTLSGKDMKKNLEALKPGTLEAGLGASLFGRMVTGDLLAQTDAAVHVAHAFTVHAQQSESDYFSAIDDLLREEGESGSGHINASELTSGLFYGYVVVDLAVLDRNLGGDKKLAAQVVERLIHMVATCSPGAKKGSTAPYAFAHLVMVEEGDAQPRTLANAFLRPVDTRGDVVENAYRALDGFVRQVDGVYGEPQGRRYVALGGEGSLPADGRETRLADLAQWAARQVSA